MSARKGLGQGLLPRRWAIPLAVLWAVALVVLVVLAWHLYRTGTATVADAQLDRRLQARLGGHRRLERLFISFGSPRGVVLGSLGLAVVMVSLRWWRGALLALLGAPLTGLVTEKVLKPLVGVPSPSGAPLSFPSGHTSGAVSLALTAAILLLAHEAVPLLPTALRLLLGLCALTVAGGTGVAMVIEGAHRVTDVVGGVATAAVIVLALAAALDRVRREPA